MVTVGLAGGAVASQRLQPGAALPGQTGTPTPPAGTVAGTPSTPTPAPAPVAAPEPAAPVEAAPVAAVSAPSAGPVPLVDSVSPVPYHHLPPEVQAEAKTVASRVAERLTNYGPDTDLGQLAAQVVPGDGARQAAVAEAARPLFHPGRWSRGVVVYPQLGGMRAARGSVMVVVRQEVGTGPDVELIETRTLDVRVVRAGGAWTFEELASAGGERVPRPADLPAEAATVVDHPHIELPDSARWDIYRGAVSPTLLRLMGELGDRVPYGVVVLESGHPHHVFGTNQVSAHTRGRAVDVYRVGSLAVVEDRARGSATYDIARWLYSHRDVSQLGSPWAFDGRGGRSFTDEVHQDHLHIAVRY